LRDLGRLDDRIAAHLDGLAVAGQFGSRLCEEALETPGVGEAFAAAVRAVEEKDTRRLDRLFAVAEAAPEAERGLISAYGWLSAQYLKGSVSELLHAAAPFRKRAGIAACALHRVDPGAALNVALASPDLLLRARGLRCAGEVGRRDLLPPCVEHLGDGNPACAFWAAWSAVLLGDRGQALQALKSLCLSPGIHQMRALRLVLKILNSQDAHALLKGLAPNPANQRALIQATGIAGGPVYVPWLIKQMTDEKLTRLAGDSLTFITGLDLASLDLGREPPEGVEFGPTDNADDEDVGMDPDDGLRWPDPEKIGKWWAANGHQFQPGVRYFMGKPPTREHCIDVLKNGYQHQRIAAAEYLCLLNPGTPLFNTAAPAWRQERWLAKLA
jgi:uncharacterized protein (TIGR02270 family)